MGPRGGNGRSRAPDRTAGGRRGRRPMASRISRGGPPIGRRRWAVAEGYIPRDRARKSRALTSHETLCLLNATARTAHVCITVYFADREPVGPYRVTVPARRTRHVRFNDLDDPAPIPRTTDFSSVIESDTP